MRFAWLNPYDASVVPGSILKLEDENFAVEEEAEDRGTKRPEHRIQAVFPEPYTFREEHSEKETFHSGTFHVQEPNRNEQRAQLYCYAISAKRYALFNLDDDGRSVLRKWSEHGLGHLINPTDPESDDREWIHKLWEGIVTEALGHGYQWPAWLDHPAIGRITASSPQMLKSFTTWNRRKPYRDQVKPCNFLLTAFIAPFGHPPSVNPARFHLVAPYEVEPRKWTRLSWMNLYDATGQRYQLTTLRSDYASARSARVKTYRDVIEEYRLHAETKSLAPDGTLCVGATTGLLQRRPVTKLYLTHVGKESNRLEEMDAGLIHDPDEVYTEYQNPADDSWRTLVIPILKQMKRADLAKATGLSERSVASLRNGASTPRPKHRVALGRAAGEYARAQLRTGGLSAPHGELEACAAWHARRQ